MTAACGGGPSQPKPAFENQLVVIGVNEIVNQVQAPHLAWLMDWIPGAGAQRFDVNTFCASDPPAMPNIDAARVGEWLLPPFGATKLRQDMFAIVGNIFWPLLCDCASLQPPVLPPIPPEPPGVQVNPPNVVPPAGPGPCGSATTLFETIGSINGAPVLNHDSFGPIPSGATSLYVHWQGSPVSGQSSPFPAAVNFVCFDANNVALASTPFTDTGNTQSAPMAITVAVAPGTKSVGTSIFPAGTTNSLNYAIFAPAEWYCGGAPGLPLQPCCPPDETTQQLLYQIYSTVQEILSDLGSGKFPYKDDVVHSGLSGTGAVTIKPTAVAIRVDVTTRPPSQPDNPGTPNYFFQMGYITPFAVGTPLRGQRLVYDHQTFQYPTYTDQIGYTLPANVVVNIVELVV